MRLTGSRVYYRPSPPKMPPGLVELMEGLTKEVLKQSPTDVYGFCASHMQQLLEKRDGPSSKKSLSLEEKIARAQEKVRKIAKIRREEYDKGLLQLQQSSNDTDKDVKHDLTLQVPQVITTQVLQNVNTVSDKVNIGHQNIPNTPIHHEYALEGSAEVEISQVSEDISKFYEEDAMDNQNGFMESKIANMEITEKNEILDMKESSNETSINKIQQNVSSNVFSESENENNHVYNLQSTYKIASDVASDIIIQIDEQKENVSIDLHPKDNENVDNAGVEKDKSFVNITNEDHALKNVAETSKSRNDNDLNFDNSNNSDSDQIEDSPGKPEDVKASNTRQMLENSEQIQQSYNTDVIHPETVILVKDPQQSNTTTNSKPESTIDTLNTGSSEEIKISNTAPGIPLANDNEIYQRNNSNTVQDLNFDKDTSQIKIYENISLLSNTAPVKVLNLTEDAQLANIIHDHVKEQDLSLNDTEKLTKSVDETKKTVNSDPESDTNLSSTGVDRDILTMVTENLENDVYDDSRLKNETLHTIKISQRDEINKVDETHSDLDKVVSELHVHQDAKANSSDSNADISSIPSHSTEDGNDVSHDETSDNMSEKVQNDNQDTSNMDLETAAITIQKVFRTFLFKSRGSTFEDTANDEGNFLDENDKNKEECEFPITSALNIDRRAHGITRMDTVLQTVNEEKSLSLSTDDSSTLSSAATIIQAHVRGFLVRHKLNSNKTLSTTSLAASNSNEPSITSLEADNDQNKNKTILNIHIVPEGENCFSRDESLVTSMDLSLDSSPPSSINLHPLGYDKSERRKQLKREDAIQSISPPSNNSGKLSEDLDSVKELLLNDHDIVGEQLEDHDNNVKKYDLDKENRKTLPIEIDLLKTDLKINEKIIKNSVDDSETLLKQKRKSLTKMSSDEMDVVTPFISNEASSIIMHSGEFHDAVLPTRVSRSDTTVVSGE